jgi:DNA polymerase I-like protein with 3'-5' exonuclease and polymerase domains
MDSCTISLDTEDTGLDFNHGARPFLVTICFENGEQNFWEWDIDPLKREVLAPEDDLEEIQYIVNQANTIVGQNIRFDVKALTYLYKDYGMSFVWDWEKVNDTLLAGHILASNQPHNLTDMALHYCGINILPFEERIKDATKQARRMVRSGFPAWKIAKEGLLSGPLKDPGSIQMMPSLKASSSGDTDKSWHYDMWLPKALFNLGHHRDASWQTCLSDYANMDSAVTLALWRVQESHIYRRGLDKIYKERLKLLPIVHDMEVSGVTINKSKLDAIQEEYRASSEAAGNRCLSIASSMGYNLELPKSGDNASLRTFMIEKLELPITKRSKTTGNPSFDKYVMSGYLATLPEGTSLEFVKALMHKRKRDTAVSFMDSYRKFWLPLCDGYYRMFPSLNITGTDTLRWSSKNPNSQNIEKEPVEGRSLRYCFGPAPGREWWSCDAKNIELRIPAYEANEEEFIALFEKPDDPPYFGSNHLLVAHILHPKLFEECRNDQGIVDGRIFKKKYASTLYQWVKNGNFAHIYGAMDKADGTGTADRAYHVPGAQARINSRLRRIYGLNQHYIKIAEKYGYVETIPDRSIDPTKGYPLMCTRTEHGEILPTVPLNYHVQSTAMQWMNKAMIRCSDKLREWNRSTGFTGRICMQIHDELVFDFPKSHTHPREDLDPAKKSKLVFYRKSEAGEIYLDNRSNLFYIRQLQSLMEQGGQDIGIPTPVSCSYHEDNWEEGLDL